MGVTLAPHDGKGVIVEKVEPADLFAQAGVNAGCILLTVNWQSVKDSNAALGIISSMSTPFTIEFRTAVPLRTLVLAAQRSAIYALVCTLLTLVAFFSPFDEALAFGAIMGNLCVAGAAFLVLADGAIRRVGLATTAYCGLVLCCLALFGFLFALLAAIQLLRRCSTDVCDASTMITKEDCLQPCQSPLAFMQWPVTIVYALALPSQSCFMWRCHLLVEATRLMRASPESQLREFAHEVET